MPYSDQQIADYAHKLEAKGAPSSDIETFVKAAKFEQTQQSQVPTASDVGGAAAKGIIGALNPANLPQNIANAAQFGMKAAVSANKAGLLPSDAGVQKAEQAKQDLSDQAQAAYTPLGPVGVQAGKAVTAGLKQAGEGIAGMVSNEAQTGLNLGKSVVEAAQGKPIEQITAAQPEAVKTSQGGYEGLSNVAGGVAGTVAAPFSGAVSAVPDDLPGVPGGGKFIKDAIGGITGLPANAAGAVAEWLAKQINPNMSPEDMQRLVVEPIKNAANLGLVTTGTLYPKPIAEVGAKMAEAGKAGLEATGNVAKEVGKSALSQASGLEKGTIETAFQSPEALSKGQEAGIPATRQAAFEQLKNPIDEKINELSTKAETLKTNTLEKARMDIDQALEDLSDTGKGYDSVRGSKTPVNVSAGKGSSVLEQQILKNGFAIEDGKIVTTANSPVGITSGDLAFLNDIYKRFGKYTKLTPEQVLNLRGELSVKGNYANPLSSQFQMLARDMRSELNKKAVPQVQGLAELDAAYSSKKTAYEGVKELIYDKKTGKLKPGAADNLNKLLLKGDPKTLAILKNVIPNFEGFTKDIGEQQAAISDLKDISKVLYNTDGSLKDNAVSIASNLMNKGKEGMLGRIQKHIPDFDVKSFAEQVKVVKALEDIERAQGIKVGTYTRSMLVGGSLFAGAIPAIAMAWLTAPKTVIGIVKALGKR